MSALHERVLDWLASADRQQLRDLIDDEQRTYSKDTANAAFKACAKVGRLQPKGRTAPYVKIEGRLQNAAHAALQRNDMHDTMDFAVLFAIVHHVIYLEIGEGWLTVKERALLADPIMRALAAEVAAVPRLASTERSAHVSKPAVSQRASVVARSAAEAVAAFDLGDW